MAQCETCAYWKPGYDNGSRVWHDPEGSCYVNPKICCRNRKSLACRFYTENTSREITKDVTAEISVI